MKRIRIRSFFSKRIRIRSFFSKRIQIKILFGSPPKKGSGSDPFRITSKKRIWIQILFGSPLKKGSGSRITDQRIRIRIMIRDLDHGSWIYRSKFHLITELLSVSKGRFSVVYGVFLKILELKCIFEVS